MEQDEMDLGKPRIFRATREAWLGQLLLPLAFFSLLTFTAVRHSELQPAAASLGLVILIGIFVADYLLPMLRDRLTIDSRGCAGSIQGREFRVDWGEVTAAWPTWHKNRRYLCLGTKEETLVVPLRFLDGEDVLAMARTMLPGAAWGESALRQLPEFQSWLEQRVKHVDEGQETRTVVDHWIIQLVCWTIGGLSFFQAARFFSSGDAPAAAVWAFGALLCLFILSRWGVNEIGSQSVSRSSLFERSSIDWSDVRGIEIDPLGAVIVLIGERSQLAISGPWLWCGAEKSAAFLYLISQAKSRSIPLRRTYGALLRTSGQIRSAR